MDTKEHESGPGQELKLAYTPRHDGAVEWPLSEAQPSPVPGFGNSFILARRGDGTAVHVHYERVRVVATAEAALVEEGK